jgi:hypothetical protein
MLMPATMRRYATAFLAALVVASNLHCVATSAHVCLRTLRAVRSAAEESAREGCIESGCMCRGAILAPAVDGRELTPQLSTVTPGVVWDVPLSEPAVALLEVRLSTAEQIGPPPVSGRELRAHIASLLI